jgi:polar amino acid transport system substrate-binding protein
LQCGGTCTAAELIFIFAHTGCLNMKLKTVLLLSSLLLGSWVNAEPLRIVSEEWPPFIYAENGHIKGADKDVTEYLLSQLGYQVEWSLMPWRRVLREAEDGSADAILDIAPHPIHLKTYLFTDEPLSSHETMLFYAMDRPLAYRNIDDLSGLVVGVSPGYLYNNHRFVTSDTFRREPAPTFEANLQKLVRGRVDLVALSRPVGVYTSRALGIDHRVSYHPIPLSHSEFYLAFNRTSTWEEPARAFSKALKAFKKTDAYSHILRQYHLESVDGKLTLATPD